MVTVGVDASQRLNPQAVTDAKFGFAARYHAPLPNPKCLTADEAKALLAGGVDIVSVWEATASRALDGHDVGLSDGGQAKQQADSCGAPPAAPIFWAVDFDAQPSQYDQLAAYGQGFAEGASPHPAGPYGSANLLDAMGSRQLCPYGWQTAAWSHGRLSPYACLYQRVQQTTVGGVTCDIDVAIHDNYGGWLAASNPGGHVKLAMPACALIASVSGQGYWIVAQDGGIFAFGDAPAFPDPVPGLHMQPGHLVCAAARTSTGRGLWLAASDGGVFAFGDAAFHGSAGGTPLAAPITGIAPTPSDGGYWLVGADGGIFAYGDAQFEGSVPALGTAAA